MEQLTREQEIDVFLDTAMGNLEDKKEYKLGLQIIKWAEERQKLRFIEYCNFLLSNRLHPEYSLKDLRSEIVREIEELKGSIKSSQKSNGGTA